MKDILLENIVGRFPHMNFTPISVTFNAQKRTCFPHVNTANYVSLELKLKTQGLCSSGRNFESPLLTHQARPTWSGKHGRQGKAFGLSQLAIIGHPLPVPRQLKHCLSS